jgi:hypothetical protein
MNNELTRKAHVLMSQELFEDFKILCMKEKTSMSEDLRAFAAERVKEAKEKGILK